VILNESSIFFFFKTNRTKANPENSLFHESWIRMAYPFEHQTLIFFFSLEKEKNKNTNVLRPTVVTFDMKDRSAINTAQENSMR